MFIRRTACVLVLSFAFAANAAHAFFDPPWITPAAPRAGEPVSINVQGGICDVFVDAPGYPQITVQGTEIHIVRYGWHEGFQDFCIFGNWTVADTLGSFAEGDYTATVDFLYDDALFGPTIVNLGVVPFSVTGAATYAPIPAVTEPGKAVLVILILSLAAWSVRKRQGGRC